MSVESYKCKIVSSFTGHVILMGDDRSLIRKRYGPEFTATRSGAERASGSASSCIQPNSMQREHVLTAVQLPAISIRLLSPGEATDASYRQIVITQTVADGSADSFCLTGGVRCPPDTGTASRVAWSHTRPRRARTRRVSEGHRPAQTRPDQSRPDQTSPVQLSSSLGSSHSD